MRSGGARGHSYIWTMIDALRRFLSWPPEDQAAPLNPTRAASALMVEVSYADAGHLPAQQAVIRHHLASLFDLSSEEAAAEMALGEEEQAAAPDLVRFTRVLKTGLDHEARVALMTALWAIVLADGKRHPQEDALLRRLPPLLAITDHDSARARRRAMAEAEATPAGRD